MMTTNIANPGYRPQTMASFDRFSRYNYIGSAYGRLGGSTGALDRSYGTTTSGTTSALKTIGLPTKTSTKTVTFAPGTRGKDMSYSDRYSSSDRYTSSSAPLSSYRSSVGNLLSSTSTYRDSYGYRQDRDYDSSKYSSRLSTSSHPTANTSSSYGRYSSGEYSSTSATSKSSSGGYCTADDLSECLRGGVGAYISHTSYNEVFPNIFIGDQDSSENCPRLRRLGIRHVLNAAYGYWCRRTVQEYKDSGIRFLGIEADDCESYQMHPYFHNAADFIEAGCTHGTSLYMDYRNNHVGMTIA
ncbi:PREDICTED: uncharacterized protein LOC109461908 isoform X3 [Branchiostoma belcheri]|uniref:Uncharacterized protein LOC109461908 isoform X3 n=1 Tax=Branchiostoma belcheri TaxID=7741 RepID=A0A6P4YAV4_BRABE|nr:PREDICTED: uncharacterized protein LOC109461908 isoform X3 [Branchiostoma belcheri]